MGNKLITPESYLDSVTFKMMNINQDFIRKNFFDKDNFKHHPEKFEDKKFINQTRIYDLIDDKNRTICKSNHTRPSFLKKRLKKDSGEIYFEFFQDRDESLNLKSHGIKTYDDTVDSVRSHFLDKSAFFVKNYDIDFCFSNMAISFDIDIHASHSIDNFMLIKLTKAGKKTNNPNKKRDEHYDCYTVESSVNPRIKAQIYSKTQKELKIHGNDIGIELYRCEITLNNLEDLIVVDDYGEIKKDNIFKTPIKYIKDSSKLLEHIEKSLANYRLFYFDNPDDNKQLKSHFYSNTQIKSRSPMDLSFPKTQQYNDLSDEIFKKCTYEIELKLQDNIRNFIVDTLEKVNQPLEPEMTGLQKRWLEYKKEKQEKRNNG